MKRHSLLALVIAGLFVAAWAGIAPANEGHDSNMSNDAGSSGSWSWYTEGPAETGAIPGSPPEGVSVPEDTASPSHELSDSMPGGLDFRKDIDEGP